MTKSCRAGGYNDMASSYMFYEVCWLKYDEEGRKLFPLSVLCNPVTQHEQKIEHRLAQSFPLHLQLSLCSAGATGPWFLAVWVNEVCRGSARRQKKSGLGTI